MSVRECVSCCLCWRMSVRDLIGRTLSLVEFHMKSIKSCGYHVNLVGSICISINIKERVQKNVRECDASISLFLRRVDLGDLDILEWLEIIRGLQDNERNFII